MMRIALTILLATSTAMTDPVAARDLQEVLNTGSLRVGITLFPPWATRSGNGELIGFEVDVARQLAADMGVKAELLAYDVERLVPALEAGEIDVRRAEIEALELSLKLKALKALQIWRETQLEIEKKN